jgi:hypothetical protein
MANSGYAAVINGRVVVGRKGSIVVEMLCCDAPGCDIIGFIREPGEAHRIVASLVDIGNDILAEMEGHASLWTRSMIEHEIGRVHIQRMIGEREPGLLDELESRMTHSHQIPEPTEHIVRPFMTAADVHEIGSKTVGGFRYRLELVPHHIFRYDAKIGLDGMECGSVNGQIAVNALTGALAEWPADCEAVAMIEEPHRVLEPIVDREEAAATAKKGVTALHTTERDMVREARGAVITERKKMMPMEAALHLEGMGLFYLPIWLVEGLRGVLIVNAATGKIVSEDLYTQDLA